MTSRKQTVSMVDLSNVKTQLVNTFDHAEGETANLAGCGGLAARISDPENTKKPIPFEELAAFRARMPQKTRSIAELLREMRDEGF